MVAQAGWYTSPGEPGTLRYWSGEAWTNHRQPPPALVPAPASEPDPYSQGAESHPTQSSDQPSRFESGVGLGFTVDGIPVGPGALPQLSELADVRSGLETAMRQAKVNAGSQPRSTALRGALKGTLVGLVMIAIGAALILFFSGQENVGSGEATVQGIVIHHVGLGSECKPQVQFQVRGQSYQADSGIGGSCSANPVDDTVPVIYSIADPAHTGRYDFGNPVEAFVLILPVLGIVVFLSGLTMFFVRLVRRRAQFAQPTYAP